MAIPRPEHPKPQFERANWKNLNGEWSFEIDQGCSGFKRGLSAADARLSGTILVPFCPESKLSGVGHTDFIHSVWYQRKITLTEAECAQRVFLHFGAVDHECDVYLNGVHAGFHKGGYVSFKLEITALVKAGENVLTVHARDDSRDPLIPSGKQSERYESYGCFYTRTTGIWQTVWLEFTPKNYIRYAKLDPDVATTSLTVTSELEGVDTLTVKAYYEGKLMGEAVTEKASGFVIQRIQLAEEHLWEPGMGRLYDLELTFGEDTVKSYFGLRSVRLDGVRFLINERSVFQRLVLDQGFYPDGIYTAPSDEALIRDIDLSMAVGFNGARLHEKIFEERFLYHCDRKGYLVWGEYPNWGLDHSRPDSIYGILPEWLEELKRDYNHPAIIGWCPFNETWDVEGRKQYDDVLRLVYRATKAVDPVRPCIDTSGNYHVETDIFDVHDYDQNPETFKAHYDELMTNGTLYDQLLKREYHGIPRQIYTGGPTFVSEYGGIRWTNDTSGWGYGDAPKTMEEFKTRFEGLTNALLDNHLMFGLCYTQLTDVEQEQNGVYTYQRESKFDADWMKSVLSRKAAIED